MKKILVIDDEVALVTFMSELLESRGYGVIGSSDVDEALGIFTKKHNDIGVVVMDLTMPKKTGMELSADMKEINKDVPIFLVTGYLDQLQSGSLESSSIDEYLEKPISIAGFLETLGKYMKK